VHWMALSGYLDRPRQQRLPALSPEANVLSDIPDSMQLAPIVTVPFPLLDQGQSDILSRRYASTPSQRQDSSDGTVEDFDSAIPNVGDSDENGPHSEKYHRIAPLHYASLSPELPLQFVNSHGPPVKRGSATGAQIRAHAMRRVHQQRRIAKIQAAAHESSLGHSETTGACLCKRLSANGPTSQVSRPSPRPSHISQPAHRSEPPGSIVLIAHLDTPEAAAHQFPLAATNASVVCRQCGNLKLLSSPPTDQNLAPTPYSGSPFNSSSTFDPFASTSVHINHRMHELLNHCKSNSH
jgi:hypothetical protein